MAKLKFGLISNSSSSSFIIGLPKKPKNQAETQSMFYPDGRSIVSDYHDDIVPSYQAAEMIFDQLKSQKPLKETQIAEVISHGWYPDRPDYDFSTKPSDLFRKEYKEKMGVEIWDAAMTDPKNYNKYQKLLDKERRIEIKNRQKAALEYWKKNKSKFKNKKIFVVEFGDHHGPVYGTVGSIMENGNAFRSVPNLKISHH